MAEASKDEQIGFHKGAMQTLLNERNELIRLVGVTEALVQAHAKELEKLGVTLRTDKNKTGKSTLESLEEKT